jgi:RNA polymerase sigma factor (TIGR02999 family)
MAAEFSTDLYQELRRIAAYLMRQERANHTLQPTAVVHEAWLRFGDLEGKCNDRKHFLLTATRVIREVLCDHARARGALKRGGGRVLQLDDNQQSTPAPDFTQLLELNLALDALQRKSERAARVVELKYFGQLTTEEIASVLEVSERTVKRDWEYARAWLQAWLGEAENDPATLQVPK